MAPRIPPIVSVDDHVLEPADLWQRRLPAKYKEFGPKVIRAPFERNPVANRLDQKPFRIADSGPEMDFWVYEHRQDVVQAGLVAPGLDLEELGHSPMRWDRIRPACYEVKPRLEDMDVNGVERSLCFPTMARFCGQNFLEANDKEVALACVQVYNDFIVEEWAGESGGRLIPLMIVPLWDPRLAAAEVRRNAARGVTAVSFSEIPAYLGLPSIHDADRYWDPFLRACDETGTVICMHIGSGSNVMATSSDAPAGVGLAILTQVAQASFADWLLSGVLARFANVQLAYSEAQVGWWPYVMEQIDRIWRKPRAVSNIDPAVTELPSSYVPGRVFGCFFEDDFGVKVREHVGVDQITFECDYPHQDTTWPNTKAYAEKAFAGVPDDEIEKIVRGNAIRLFRLPEDLPAA
jgi:predicted TIM-barrel fold metal-dependent hydrolase